jgi:hypothetical protein
VGEVFVECTWITVFSLVLAALESKRRIVSVIRRISPNCTASGVFDAGEGLPLSACFYIPPVLPADCVNDPKPLVASEEFHMVISTYLRVKGRIERCIGG